MFTLVPMLGDSRLLNYNVFNKTYDNFNIGFREKFWKKDIVSET